MVMLLCISYISAITVLYCCLGSILSERHNSHRLMRFPDKDMSACMGPMEPHYAIAPLLPTGMCS